MFDLSDRPLVWIPVKWAVLRPGEGDDALAVETEAVIEVEVEILDREELKTLFAAEFGIEDAKPEVDGKQLEGRELETARFMKVVRDWRKVADNGKALEFNAENVKGMLSVPGFTSAFETAFLAACVGKVDIRKGN